MGIISKSDFILFLNCKKSLWLLKNKPEKFIEGESSNFERRLSAQGEKLKRYSIKLFGWFDYLHELEEFPNKKQNLFQLKYYSQFNNIVFFFLFNL